MSKRPAAAPSETEAASDEFDIPGTLGATGRGTDRGDYVSIIAGKESWYLAVYPRNELMAHMADWRFATHRFKSNGTGEIDGVKLIKGDRGSGLRKGKGSRPHFHLSLNTVTVTDLDRTDGSNETVGTVDGDAVVFTLPPLIKGKYKTFKLSRS
jgi:hypothetical protein